MDPSPYEYILIKHRKSGLYLDIAGANKAPKTNVLLWSKNGNDNQVWYLDPSTWTYRSKLNDLCLTIDSEKRNLVCDDVRNYDPNQQWQIAAMHIKNAANQYLVLECAVDAKAGHMITSGNYNGQDNQFWDVERIGGFAPPKLSNCPPMQANPGQPGFPGAQPGYPGAPPPGAQFPGYPQPGMQPGPDPRHNVGFGGAPIASGGPPQDHTLQLPHIGASVGRRYFMILTEMNGKAVDIKKGDKTAGTHIIMYKPNKDKNQQWYTDEKGYIHAAINDMVFHSNEAGHSLEMVPCIDDPRHLWKIEGNKIVNGKGQCLDIRGGHSNDGSELCAYQYNKAPNQHWKIQYL